MKHKNILYTFTSNKHYHNPLVVDYLLENEKKPSGNIVIIGLCSDAVEIIIPEFIGDRKVVGIDENAFSGYNTLKSITIPNTVERVASSAIPNNVMVKFNGKEMSAKDFYAQLNKQQRSMTHIQLQGFAIIDKNKKWRKSINIIKKSKDWATAQQNLVKKLGLSSYQANCYLNCGIGDIALISYMNINEKIRTFEKCPKNELTEPQMPE